MITAKIYMNNAQAAVVSTNMSREDYEDLTYAMNRPDSLGGRIRYLATTDVVSGQELVLEVDRITVIIAKEFEDEQHLSSG